VPPWVCVGGGVWKVGGWGGCGGVSVHCWVLRQHTRVVWLFLVADRHGIKPAPFCWWCEVVWCGGVVLVFENCIVDASIFDRNMCVVFVVVVSC
jgi:hypothetical protein